jgi:hypothetical protein
MEPVRLWSLHPRYLDPQGLVALWREGLLARAVLQAKTKGYRRHPQLDRFKAHPAPRLAISTYLRAVYLEAAKRGYSFDVSKIGSGRTSIRIPVTDGQVAYEWQHLRGKLAARNPRWYRQWRSIRLPQCHPLMRARIGRVEAWERSSARASH